MFVVSISLIKNGVEPLKFSGTSALIPRHFAHLIAGGDRSIDAVISIDSNLPDHSGVATWTGNDAASIADWLTSQYGMYGKPVGENPSPIDLIHSLTKATWLEWEIVEGRDILDLPVSELPPGAIA